jgi:hypothetical protein
LSDARPLRGDGPSFATDRDTVVLPDEARCLVDADL